jgi:nucleoside-diphosphate-sugar epimerase
MKILITGGAGYIAKNIVTPLSLLHDVTTITRREVDLLNLDNVNAFFENKFYDVIIHTAIKGGSRLIEDSISIIDDNVRMLDNIICNKSRYSRLLNIGSGAELTNTLTPYSISKRQIANKINALDNHFNIRIFAVFNENEINTRFIKSNIIRYILKQNLEIHQNKFMDFFSIYDLIQVLEMYITTSKEDLDKEFDCCYTDKKNLVEISTLINKLDNYSVAVNINRNGLGEPYVGNCNSKYNFKFKGLEKSIEEMFKILKTREVIIS